jgi:GDP-4-dehydro-6-deoxy-D-mannose reductase
MRVLVTGAGGFAGVHLVRLLIERGYDVVGLVRSSSGPISDHRIVRCDLMHHRRLASIVRELRPERVFHLAGLTRPRLSWQRPRDFYRVNVMGTIHLLEAVRKAGMPCRALAVSSGAAYRSQSGRRPHKEDAATDARDPYSSSKLLMEAVALDYFRIFQMPVVIARPFNHCGPGQPAGFVVSDFCSQAARIEAGRQKAPLKTGSLNAVRDLLDVRDVVSAYCELLETGEAGEIYNVCSGEGVSLARILELVREKARAPLSVRSEKASHRGPDVRIGSPEKLSRATGFERRYTLAQTIEDTLEFWRAAVAAE